MLPKNFFLKSLLPLLLLSLNSCSSVPNVPVCVEINLTKARCVKIISGEQFVIDEDHKFEGRDWWSMRPTVVQVPASSWVEIKKFIIKICKKTNRCEKEIASWDRSIQSIDDNLANKPGVE